MNNKKTCQQVGMKFVGNHPLFLAALYACICMYFLAGSNTTLCLHINSFTQERNLYPRICVLNILSPRTQPQNFNAE